MEWLAHFIQYVLVRWGYLALAAGLLGENAGLPLPGETILLYSSFLAHKAKELNIIVVVLVGIAAAVLGDNLGFLAGKHFGPRLLNWLKRKFHMDEEIAAAADQMKRHGPATVFWARYIFGLRTIAGPVAGALGMEWKKFLVANILGAATWVTCIAMSGYLFANKFQSFAGFIEKVSWGITGGIFLVGYILWRRKKKQMRERQQQGT
jgi:membrane protein DedA with SNARE-associated domain